MDNLDIMKREKVLEILKKYNSQDSDFIHFLESEAVMRELAKKIELKDEEVNYWAIIGLIHDIDWGLTKNDVQTHLKKAPEILKKEGFSEEFIETVISHGYGCEEIPHLRDKKRTKRIEHALAASETITGLIHAYALMRGKKIEDMDYKGLKKKFKDKSFAAKVNREIIKECEKVGLSLDDFFKISIEGIKKIKNQVGLE
ncbi:HDIG domain-containing protein [Patescibacteria group bacterium]|nr:HDIG domain-containing protein [Patescibacteria group bacterium]